MIYLLTLLIFIKILDLCYLFQTKEYRFDRFRSMVFEVGFLNVFYIRNPKLPARTVRNFVIMGISSTLLLIGLLIYTQLFVGWTEMTISLVLSPAIAFIFVSSMVILTRPLAYVVRTARVSKAVNKLKQFPNLVSIGVSGSYGKTSTKEYLYQLLSTKFSTAKTDKNQNSDVGVANGILQNITPQTKYFVGEVAGYKRGEVRKATQVFNPQHAIITGFGNQHLDLYGSRENLIDSESEILELLPNTGTAYINRDVSQYQSVSQKTKAGVVSYSSSNQSASINASNIKVANDGSLSADITYDKRRFSIATSLLGRHTIENLLPCIAFCLDQGMTTNEVIVGIKGLKQVEGKLSRHLGPNGASILNDTGNSSLNGFLAAIMTVESLKYPQNLIISKGIIELGKEKKESYKQIISALINRPIQLHTTDKLFNSFGLNRQVVISGSEKQLLDLIVPTLDRSTLVLLEGKFTPGFIKSFVLI